MRMGPEVDKFAMTEIKFFFNVDNKLQFACKIAKRAHDDGRKLIVYAPSTKLTDEFDRMLWTFSQLSFVPHVKAGHPLAAETSIVIVNDDVGRERDQPARGHGFHQLVEEHEVETRGHDCPVRRHDGDRDKGRAHGQCCRKRGHADRGCHEQRSAGMPG